MNPWDGKAALFLRTGTNIIILNLLWILTSMLIFTIGPSTAAMIGVIRKWHLNKEDSVIRCYFIEYRKFLKQGFMIGTSWICLGILLLADAFFFLQITSSLKVVFMAITAIVFILYLMTSAHLFSILAHYETKGFALIKQAFTFSFLDVGTTFAIILMWIVAGTVFFYAPLSVLVIIVPLSMVTFRFSIHSFEKIEKLKRIQTKYPLLEK